MIEDEVKLSPEEQARDRAFRNGFEGIDDVLNDAFTAGARFVREHELALVTDERDKAIERCAIFERAVDHYITNCSLCHGKGEYHTPCSLCGDSTYDHFCNDKVVQCGRCDIAVKAKKDAEEVG